MTQPLIRSYAESNRELVESFVRYMESRGLSPHTLRAYGEDAGQYVRGLGGQSAVSVTRVEIRVYQASLLRHGLSDRSVDRKTKSLRCFYKFLRLADLLKFDPMFQISQRKVPKRLPRVLTVEEVERVIGAATNPAERAIAEVLYSTGVRVSEVCQIKIENMIQPDAQLLGTILIQRGKGGKDRLVLYGQRATKAIAE